MSLVLEVMGTQWVSVGLTWEEEPLIWDEEDGLVYRGDGWGRATSSGWWCIGAVVMAIKL